MKERDYVYYESIGDKIVSKENNSSVVLIRKSKLHDILWASFFFLMGICMFFYFGKNSIGHFNITFIIMLLFVSLPAFGLGMVYFIKSRKKLEFSFDFKKKHHSK